LIDLPEGSRLVDWSQSYQGTGRILVTKAVTVNRFHGILRDRIETLRLMKHQDGESMLGKVIDLRLPNAQAITYWNNELVQKNTFIECDAYYLKNQNLYKFQNMIDLDPVAQEQYFRDFKDMLEAIRPRRPDEIPTDPGSCFDDSIMLDGPNRDYSELVMATGIWPDRPDVRFNFAILDNGPNPDPPLLTRLARAGPLDGWGVLRSRNRTVGDLAGQEHLERVKDHRNGAVGHLFVWETQGLPNRWDFPQIRLEMTTGEGRNEPQDASLSDQDALNLWDQVVDSLRWRPTST
jgi:hypothetical protein